MSEDYYALLGVEPDASEEAILQAFREKAAEHHPDVSDASDAEATFQRLNRAKDVLTNAERRREYDRIGHDQFVRQEGHDGDVDRDTDVPSGRMAWPTALGEDLERVFGVRWSQDVDPRADLWPGRRAPSGSRTTVDLTDHFRGGAAFNRDVGSGPTNVGRTSTSPAEGQTCPNCRGRGSFVHDIDTTRGRTRRIESCERCGGSGSVPE